MKLGFYHYYFKRRKLPKAPRVSHDIRALLKAYLEYGDNEWKSNFETDDGEKLFIMRSPHPQVLMLVGTRKDDLIKAINAQTMTCSDLVDRLKDDEEAGFAGYFICDQHMIGMASTLRGPKAAALQRLLNDLITKLQAARWKFVLEPLGTSVTMETAKKMAFVSRTEIKLRHGNPLFNEVRSFLALDEDSLSSVEIVLRAKKSRDINDAVKKIANDVGAVGIDRMLIRAKAALDDDLLDYFVAANGNYSEELGVGTEKQITQSIAKHFIANQKARGLLESLMQVQHYAPEDKANEIEALARLGNADHWSVALQTQLPEPSQS